MGNLVWHEYARLVSLTASIYTLWASFWGFYYRKFFWDFVGGTVRDPGGIQPSKNAAVFIALIVKAPVIQIFSFILAVFLIALDRPLPLLKGTILHRSMVVRIVGLIFQAFLAVLYYQGTNGALWSLVAVACWTRAITLGETMEEAKGNRGKGGRA